MHEAGATANPIQPHVLIVEDDAEIAALLSRYLGGSGFRTSTAAMKRAPRIAPIAK